MILTRPGASAISITLAAFTHISYCLSAYILARSLAIDVSAVQCITLIPPVILMTTLPISIGGWGVREAGMVGMLGLVGVSQAAALMLSIQTGLLSIIVSLPASLIWLAYRKRTPHPLPADGSATAIGAGG
jgi:hypothetical protein